MKKNIIEEYNNYFRKKPTKWASEDRNKFTFARLAELFDKTPRTVLDIGCGNGHTIEFLSKKWINTKFYGLDLSDVAIDIAKRKNIQNALFKSCFLQDIEYDIDFDLVIMLGVLEHFEDIKNALQHVIRLCSLDTIIYIEVPNCIAYPQSEHHEGFRRLTVGSKQIEWHLERSTWENHFHDAGFEIIQSIKGPNIQSEFIWALRMKP